MLTASPARSATKRATKRATNVSLAEDILTQAKALNINISQAAEAGIAQAISRKRAERWLAENHEAIESSNAFVEKHGLPLANYRMF
ncbi:type II toxin-antitoxin system CcdA family antitoxin [Orrella marina]|uniref:Post-segregation antitoxin CcdA n=1 Tax=Orrella marina TaxID=2163011 RepID=A0A2R4XFD6_9BURK|nr:type II toxin-antitoxin system CcdA family antitoxin [Orrella marina]AWB32515.1 post-segregation antitoxin CcdA [Orrella marina]